MAGVVPLRGGEPARVGPYEIVGRLGRGGQGTVYLGHRDDDPQRTPVAIKVLHPQFTDDPRARARLLREATIAKKVARFCTAQVLDVGEDDERVYLVSEYVPGSSLTDLLDRDGPRTGVALERLAISTVTALAAIHEADVVHLDFKPANVLIGSDGPIVIDFGIARGLDAAATASTGQLVGSPAYMAPEQYNGTEVGPAADMFAWGVTMVHAATGVPAFGLGSAPTMMQRILMGEPDLTGLEPPLHGLVAACVAKDPTVRPSARDILLALIGQAQLTTPDAQLPELRYTFAPPPSTTPPTSQPPFAQPPSPTEPQPDPRFTFAPPPTQPGSQPPLAPPPSGSQFSFAPPSSTEPQPPRGGRGKGLAIAGAAVGVAVIAIAAAVGLPKLSGSDHQAAGVSSAPPEESARPQDPGASGVPGAVPTGAAARSGSPSPSHGAGSSSPTAAKPAPATPSKKYVPPPATNGSAPQPRPIPWTLNQICGSGMSVVDSHSLGRATVYLMYDNSSGMNCVTTTVQTSTGSTTMGAYVEKQGGSANSDTGNYAFYAGPVKVSAKATCVKWGGTYGSDSWTSGWSHCG